MWVPIYQKYETNSNAGKCDTSNSFLQSLKYHARQPITTEPIGKRMLMIVTANGLIFGLTNSIAGMCKYLHYRQIMRVCNIMMK